MNTKYLFLGLLIFSSANLLAQAKTDTVKVWGNCDECKDKIEKAAKKGGAISADWNEDSYMLVINYNADKTSPVNIEKEVAAVGYDTKDIKAADAAYKKLPKCCQYKRDENIEMMKE